MCADKVIDGVGLVAVGDYQPAVKGAHGVVDDQTGVGKQRRVMGLGAHIFTLGHEYTVAAVYTAAHDKVSGHDALAVLALTDNDAPAGVGVSSQVVKNIDRFHMMAPFINQFLR